MAFRRVLFVFLLLFVTGFSAFPGPWNTAMQAMDTKLGFALPKFSEQGFRLGLDLQGGLHLVYDADMSSIPEEDRADALEGVRDVIERRANALGVSESRVETALQDGHYRVIVEMPGMQDTAEAMRQIGETPVLEFMTPTAEVATEPTAEQQAQIDAAQATERAAALEVLEKALDGEDVTSLGGVYVGFVYTDDDVYGELVKDFSRKQRTGVIDGLYESGSSMYVVDLLSTRQDDEAQASHILVCYAGATRCTSDFSAEEAKAKAEELAAQATAENFAELAAANSTEPGVATSKGDLGAIRPEDSYVQSFKDALFALEDGEISGVVETDFGYHVIYRRSSERVIAFELSSVALLWTTASDVLTIDPWENSALSGKHIRRASVAFDPTTSAPYVLLDFNSEGAELFGTLTAENVGQVIGIFLDGEAVTTPVVNEAIYGGQAQISGNFTVQEAKQLAQRLNAGALPVPITPVSQQTVGPTLGAASLDASVQAALIGFALVAIFMVLYYRLPGLLAVIALTLYASINLAVYKWYPPDGVTLTLAGLTGFVLSIGIAVDANVLIFERLKEELQRGRDLPTAIKEAVARAWPSIRDGNATTLIATAILFVMFKGTFVQGFATTLTIGVLVSMFSAMVVTRWLLQWAATNKRLRTPRFYLGIKK